MKKFDPRHVPPSGMYEDGCFPDFPVDKAKEEPADALRERDW